MLIMPKGNDRFHGRAVFTACLSCLAARRIGGCDAVVNGSAAVLWFLDGARLFVVDFVLRCFTTTEVFFSSIFVVSHRCVPGVYMRTHTHTRTKTGTLAFK